MAYPISRERIERAARIYSSNQDAGAALGIASGSFSRLCKRYGIPTPRARRQRPRSTRSQTTKEAHPWAQRHVIAA